MAVRHIEIRFGTSLRRIFHESLDGGGSGCANQSSTGTLGVLENLLMSITQRPMKSLRVDGVLQALSHVDLQQLLRHGTNEGQSRSD